MSARPAVTTAWPAAARDALTRGGRAATLPLVSLAREYERQFAFRSWSRLLDALPPLGGRLVLDLGCGVGDQAAQLAARGARVIGVDANEELLRAARARALPGVEIREADLRALPDLGVVADGIWCSFTAAYFIDLQTALASWARHLRPGGFIAVTEIDDFFGHEPVSARARALLDGYVADALLAGRYDFRMGGKLRRHLERCGFTITRELALDDRELAFDGPAPPEVIDAWRTRLDRMKLLHTFCGAEIDAVRDDFLGCLSRDDHRSTARVIACIATR